MLNMGTSNEPIFASSNSETCRSSFAEAPMSAFSLSMSFFGAVWRPIRRYSDPGPLLNALNSVLSTPSSVPSGQSITRGFHMPSCEFLNTSGCSPCSSNKSLKGGSANGSPYTRTCSGVAMSSLSARDVWQIQYLYTRRVADSIFVHATCGRFNICTRDVWQIQYLYTRRVADLYTHVVCVALRTLIPD